MRNVEIWILRYTFCFFVHDRGSGWGPMSGKPRKMALLHPTVIRSSVLQKWARGSHPPPPPNQNSIIYPQQLANNPQITCNSSSVACNSSSLACISSILTLLVPTTFRQTVTNILRSLQSEVKQHIDCMMHTSDWKWTWNMPWADISARWHSKG